MVGRERYHFHLEKCCKRYFTCYDDERDEIIKKLRRNGMAKLRNEMEMTRILKRMRNVDTMFKYLLTERQRFLLKFNDRHVINSDSQVQSATSNTSLFSCDSDGNKEKAIK